jgi:hypothetical protein
MTDMWVLAYIIAPIALLAVAFGGLWLTGRLDRDHGRHGA